MKSVKESIVKVLTGASSALFNYPSAIGFALAFALVTLFRIEMDWEEQQSLNFLFNCLHLSLASGALYSLAALTGIKSKMNSRKAFIAGNLSSLLIAALIFLLLYYTSGIVRDPEYNSYVTVSGLASARISVFMLLSALAFIVFASSNDSDFPVSNALFMTLKAFFVASIYGLVILAGTSGVIGAFQALVYPELTSKVYQYTSTIIGFLAFTLFVGYFPDFSIRSENQKRINAEHQPRFIEILFSNILVPLLIAMTGVLLIWTFRILSSGIQVPFVQLSSIATSYALAGVWLHIMVSEHKSTPAVFFKKFFPYAALLILSFQAYALVIQLEKYGLKTTEYFFILVWIAAVVASLLLIIKKSKSHKFIIYTICILAVISVLPVTGYHAFPVRSQIIRLEQQLTNLSILKNGELTPALTDPEDSIKASITETISFLANAENAKLPDWFDPKLNERNVFEERLGFEQTWPKYDPTPNQGQWVSIVLPSSPINISSYTWALNLENFRGKDALASNTITGDLGTYEIEWRVNTNSGVPNLKIYLENRLIIDETLKEHVDGLIDKYLEGPANSREAALEDMLLTIETEEIKVLLVFNNIELSVDPEKDSINYWINLKSLYFTEK